MKDRSKNRAAMKMMSFLAAAAVSALVGCGGAKPTVVASPTTEIGPEGKGKKQSAGGPLDLRPITGADEELLDEAVSLMDQERYAAAIRKLAELRERHPRNLIVLHELALAYRKHGEPGKAVDVLMPFRDELPVLTLAALGSALDEDERPDEAIELLEFAITVFPASGLLHSELGVTLFRMRRPAPAMEAFRRGIEAEPSWPTNYLHSANLYADRRERALAIMHGEIFRLLEPSSPRSKEMSQTIAEMYESAVTFTPVASGARNANVMLTLGPGRPGKNGEVSLEAAYERVFGPLLVAAHEKGLSLMSLHKARADFLLQLADEKANVPKVLRTSPLFMFQRALQLAGHLEAYDVWLLAPAFPQEAQIWMSLHGEAMEGMFKYMQTHPLFQQREDKEPSGGHA